MAVSGNQLTRLGASISGVGIKLTITPKQEAVIVEPTKSNSMLSAKNVRRTMKRGMRR